MDPTAAKEIRKHQAVSAGLSEAQARARGERSRTSARYLGGHLRHACRVFPEFARGPSIARSRRRRLGSAFADPRAGRQPNGLLAVRRSEELRLPGSEHLAQALRSKHSYHLKSRIVRGG